MKITAVIASRNDDYGLNITHRAYLCLRAMCQTFDEVIYVDWNSPSGVSLLEQLKIEGYEFDHHNLKEIKIGKQFLTENGIPDDAQPCCEVLARNIGITRATNDWIVSTNIDIIPTEIQVDNFSEETFYIGKKINVFDQFHLDNFKDRNLTNEQIVEFLNANKSRFHYMGELPQDSLPNRIVQIIGCGDFQLGHRSLWNAIRGFEEALLYRNHQDSNALIKAYYEDYKIQIMNEYPMYHLDHKNNLAFHSKDRATRCNSWDDATTKYAITKNPKTWGFTDKDIVIT